MDMIINEKIKISDIISSLKEIIFGNNSNVDEEKINKRLQKIYDIQSKLGATDNIVALERDLQRHNNSGKKPSRRHTARVDSGIDSDVKDIKKEENSKLEQDNTLEL